MSSHTGTTPEGNSGRRSPTPSVQSTASRKKLIDVKAKKELHKLEAEFRHQIRKKKKEINSLEAIIRKLDIQMYPLIAIELSADDQKKLEDFQTHSSEAKCEISAIKDAIDELMSELEEKRKDIIRHYELEKEEVDAQSELDLCDLPEIPPDIDADEKILKWQENLPPEFHARQEEIGATGNLAPPQLNTWFGQKDSGPSNASQPPKPLGWGTEKITPPPISDGFQHFLQQVNSATNDDATTLVQILDKLVNRDAGKKEVLIKSNVDNELPLFNGDPGQFNTFKAAFIRSQKKYTFDDSQNILRLQKALKGDAKDCVSHLMANPDNLPKILETLEDEFGRPEFVLDYLVERVKLCDKVEPNKPESIVKFGRAIDALVTNIASYNETDYLHNKQLVRELIKKLPGTLQDKWYEFRAADKSIQENLEHFSSWIAVRVAAARLRIVPSFKGFKDEREDRRSKRGPATMNVAVTADKKKKDCAACGKKGHPLDKCFKFAKMSSNERWDLVKEAKLCFKCLKCGHRTSECSEESKCNVKHCSKPHHSLLHPPGKKKTSKSPAGSDEDDDDDDHDDLKIHDSPSKKKGDSSPATMGASVVEGTDGALPIVAVKLKGPHGIINTFAMLDNGASRSLMEEDLAQELGLSGDPITISFRGFGGHMTKEKAAKSVTLNIRGNYKGSKYCQLDKVVTVEKIGVAPYSLNLEEAKKKWPCLRRIKGKSLTKVVPRIIIGSNHRHLSIPREVLCSSIDGPVATRTLLGWVLEGKLENGTRTSSMFYSNVVVEELDSSLHSLIKDSFRVDDFGIKPAPSRHSVEDKRALQIMESTTLMSNGRWETGLLWRNEDVQLPESYNEALKRLSYTEKRMKRDPAFNDAYKMKMQEYLKKGYIIKIQEDDDMKPNPKKFFIPHFGVTNPNKPGKFRLVFDAAAKCHGSSLNDHLLTGPDLLRPLPSVLWNFRVHPFVIGGDIEDMFHRVKIRNEDKPSQRFLWRDGDDARKPDVYEMQVMIFGATSSPSSAIYVKDRNAALFKDKYPEAYRAITEDFYMDDCLSGGDNEEELAKLRKDITHVNIQGGFHIKKWISNSETVMKTIAKDLQLTGGRSITDAEGSTERVLGLWWDPHEDYFTFKTNFHRVDPEILEGRRPTKREVCRLVMSLFDPLGFIGHYRIKGMMVLQSVWRAGIGWDDEVPDDVFELWKIWIAELPSITNVRISRCYALNLKDADRVELHTFVDASKEAYAAVSYLRIIENDNIGVSFVSSKVKVAPLKALTIPRLELQAAVLGAKLANTLSSELRININVKYFWSDSRTVLSWIKSETARLKEFVGNRVGAIQELTNASDWRWISTKENVADEATRFGSITEFGQDSRWFNGPTFLSQDEREWPSEKRVPEDEGPISEVFGIGSSSDERGLNTGDVWLAIPNAERFSSYSRLIRVVAAVRVAALFWRNKTKYHVERRQLLHDKKHDEAKIVWTIINRMIAPWEKSGGSAKVCRSALTPDDIADAEKRMFRYIQKTTHLDQLEQKKNKYLKQLSPYLDQDGILRARGRIDNCEAPELVRRPIILPSKHHVTNLIVDEEHRRNAHIGLETVFNNLRKKFWIPQGRQAVRRCIGRCIACRIQRAKPVIPEITILPACRLASGNHPFTYTGIDYFGPIEVTVGRRHEKRWGVLLCCMVTRAIHIEVAHALSSDET